MTEQWLDLSKRKSNDYLSALFRSDQISLTIQGTPHSISFVYASVQMHLLSVREDQK